jgi:hypothetical protein
MKSAILDAIVMSTDKTMFRAIKQEGEVYYV